MRTHCGGEAASGAMVRFARAKRQSTLHLCRDTIMDRLGNIRTFTN